jgi:uncharacterized protein YbjT (DUF2867 family)
VHIDDIADLAVEVGGRTDNLIWDAVGPDNLTFDELFYLIRQRLGLRTSLIHVPAGIALMGAQILSPFLGDVLLTPEEVDGLTVGLLESHEPPRCKTRLGDWLEENKNKIGMKYESELKKHYILQTAT